MASLTHSALLPLPAMAATPRPPLKGPRTPPPATLASSFHAFPVVPLRLRASAVSRLSVRAAKEDFVEGDERRQEASKQVQEALRDVGERLQEAPEKVASSVGEALHSLGDRLKGAAPSGTGDDAGYAADADAGSVTSASRRAAEDVKERTGRVAESAKGRVEGAGKESGERAGGLLEDVGDRLQQAGETVKEKIQGSVEGVRTRVSGEAEESTEKVREGVSKTAEEARDKLEESVEGVRDKLREGVEGAKGKLEESVEGAKKRVGKGVERVKEGLGDMFPKEFSGADIAQRLLLSALKHTGALLAVATLLLGPAFGGPAAAASNPVQAAKEASENVLERFVAPRYGDPSDAKEAGSQHIFDAQEGLENAKRQGAKALESVQEKGREAAGAVSGAVQSPVRGTRESLDKVKDQGSAAVGGAGQTGADALGKVGEAGRKTLLEPLQRSTDVPRSIAEEEREQARFTGTPRKGSGAGEEGAGDGSFVQGNALKGGVDLLRGKGKETVEKVTPGGGKEPYAVGKDASAAVLSDASGPSVTVSVGAHGVTVAALDVGEAKDPIVTDVGNAIDATRRIVGEARGMFGGAQGKVEGAASGVRGKAEEVKGEVQGQVEGAGKRMEETAGSINEAVQEGINKAGNILKGAPEEALAGPKKALEEVTKNLPDLELGKGADKALPEEERDFRAKGSGAERGAFKDGTELGKQMEGYMEK